MCFLRRYDVPTIRASYYIRRPHKIATSLNYINKRTKDYNRLAVATCLQFVLYAENMMRRYAITLYTLRTIRYVVVNWQLRGYAVANKI